MNTSLSRNTPPNPEVTRTDLLSTEAQEEAVAIIYEKEIPLFVESELERIYEITSATLLQFRLRGDLSDVSTYVIRKGGVITVLLLFRHLDREIIVLNELIRLDQDEMRRFAANMFARFGMASVISFTAIQAMMHRFPFPGQQYHFSEDIVLKLPATEAEYFSGLENNNRIMVKRHANRLKRVFPSYRCSFYEKEEIDEQILQDIFRLHKARVHGKNNASNIDQKNFAQIADLVRAYGFVHVVRIGGRICAGLICWKIGASYETHTIAHDPRYDDYKLGMLNCYFTIRECIARGGGDFRFEWGRTPYKYQLLGSGREYDRIRVYRSWLHFALCSKLVMATAISGIASEARLWLQNAESRTGLLPRTVTRLVSLWRLRKKIGKRLSALIAVPANQKSPAAPQGG